ncbi:hypothetical protein [Paenibacillus sp. An7]|uniref:hypothetical protein n=1 Tax=Paenibacillus sp. An7 TaxID=2689577 RepID=UPI00135B6E75|nr:hypothetical protein [Paenibacillus sp. An7]
MELTIFVVYEVEQEINKRGGLRTGMLDGKISEGIVSVNTAIDTIKEKKTVKGIIDELIADFYIIALIRDDPSTMNIDLNRARLLNKHR